MQRITLHTSNYKQELIDFVQALQKQGLISVKNNNTLMWEKAETSSLCEELLLLLQHIAMQENPVYRHSPKLKDLAEGLRKTELHIHERIQLAEFTRHNKELNLEGYVLFRMGAYRERLDLILYTIVKKINAAK